MIDRSVPRDDDARLVYSTGEGSLGQAKPARRPTPAAPREPAPGVRIRLERRGSGRLVTLVTGIPGPAGALAALARSLKTACGAGGTVKDQTIELQGDHRDAVEAALRASGHKPRRAGGP